MSENHNQGSQEDGADKDIVIVTKEDFAVTDLEAPIRGSNKVDCQSLGNLYRTAAGKHEQAGNKTAARVYYLIADVLRMHFKPKDRAEPYGPLSVSNGKRSLIPNDLRGGQSEVFAAVADNIDNRGLRTRLSDVAWHNNHKLFDMAQLAINAYCDVVQVVLDGTAEFFADERTASSHSGTEMLHRACQIAKATGCKDTEGTRLKLLVSAVAQDAFNRRDHRGFLNTVELGLQFRIGKPGAVARDAETLVTTNSPDTFTSRELWQLAARAHRQSGGDAEQNRCLASAAECLVALADAEGGRGMVAAGYLMDAIQELRRIPNTRERRQQVESLLRNAQASISDEMGVVSSPVIDLTDLAKETRESVSGLSLAQALVVFADLDSSPEPAILQNEAREQYKESTVLSFISTSIVDDESKVVSKSPALTGNETEDQSAIHHRVAQNESVRRQLVASGQIEPARQLIHIEHTLGQHDFLPLVTMSPFVPEDRVHLFSLAFMRFFGGDFISALHLLVPQLENSLRHILKQIDKEPSSIQSDMTQENRNLSVLLKKDREPLEKVFGSAIIYEIENLFDFRGGPALRHELAHGLISGETCYGTDAIYACWFIFRLCCLPVFDHWEQLTEWMDGNY